MSEPQVWTAPKKAGMRAVKTSVAVLLATATVKVAKALYPPVAIIEIEAIGVLTIAYTAVWTWFTNRKKKEVK